MTSIVYVLLSLLPAPFVQGIADVHGTADLTAAFSADSSEEATGVFLSVNPVQLKTTYPPEDFHTALLGMRPFTMSSSGLPDATFTLEVESQSGAAPLIEIFDLDGKRIPMPAKWASGDLPAEVLVNALKAGEALLRLHWQSDARGPDADRVLLRIGGGLDLAGRSIDQYPYFEFPRALNRLDPLEIALDPFRHAERAGLNYDVYVVAHKTPLQWSLDRSLVDVSVGGIESAVVGGTSIRDNIVVAWSTGLIGNAGAGLGVPYDVVLDFGQDGFLDPGDLIDGFDPDEAGIYILRNTLAPGPFSTNDFEFDDSDLFLTQGFDGGSTRTMRSRGLVVYPDPLPEGKLPLITFAHGNTAIGNSYQGYRYLQEHLASYGFITASFDMFPAHVSAGIRWRGWLTNKNTERLILQTSLMDHNGNRYPPMGNGVLDGKVDGDRIITVGHSRGGEGVILQYNQLAHPEIAGIRPPGGTLQGFDKDSFLGIVAISQVTFLSVAEGSKTDDRNFLMFFGGADADVCGCASGALPTIHYNRALGNKMMCFLYGAGHGYFNRRWSCTCVGPIIMGRVMVENITTGYLLPFVLMVAQGNVPARDFFSRSPSVFRPIGTDWIPPSQPFVTLYRDAVAKQNFVIENFERNPDPFLSSSNQPVSFTVNNLFEGWLRDSNPAGGWSSEQPNGGFWWATTGAIFDWFGTSSQYEWTVRPGQADFSDDRFLSFIACQQPGHPDTQALADELEFTVTLVDAWGTESTISTSPYGPLEIAHTRSGGWGAAFRTIQLRIADFETDGAGIDLTNVDRVRINVGLDHGSPRGRIGFDDLEIIHK